MCVRSRTYVYMSIYEKAIHSDYANRDYACPCKIATLTNPRSETTQEYKQFQKSVLCHTIGRFRRQCLALPERMDGYKVRRAIGYVKVGLKLKANDKMY
jgi:hypothetical protein